MRITILLTLIIQIGLIELVYSYNSYRRNYHQAYKKGYSNAYSRSYERTYDKSRNHGNYGSGYKRPISVHKPRFPKTEVILPSGNKFSIIDPRVGRSWNCGQKAKLIDLNPNGKMSKREYDMVKDEMLRGGKFTISKIQKVENSCLWKRYKHRQKDLLMETQSLNERLLFHGSPKNLDLIHTGFNEQYANLGGKFGPGVYFADTAALSNNFASRDATNTKHILLVRVTLGKMLVVKKNNLYPHAPIGYQSVKGDITPAEYIVYRGEQAYPAYIVSYQG